jgi:hypothetical protein
MHRLARLGLVLLFVVAVAVVVGLVVAGPSERTNITGTITRDGKPLVWDSEGGHLLVLFVPEDRKPDQDPYRAETDRAAGTYRIPSIPAGRYLVAVQQFDDRHRDALQTKFDAYRTPLRFEVVADGQVIDIDLPKDLPR